MGAQGRQPTSNGFPTRGRCRQTRNATAPNAGKRAVVRGEFESVPRAALGGRVQVAVAEAPRHAEAPRDVGGMLDGTGLKPRPGWHRRGRRLIAGTVSHSSTVWHSSVESIPVVP